MAGTPYSTVFDFFMIQINDYNLITLYKQDVLNDTTELNTYLMGFMLLSIPEFDICSQDLSLRNDTTMIFDETLTDSNIQVLSKLMVKYWLGKEVRDLLSMRLHVQDVDFKTFAEANNLNAKQSALTMFKEECSQTLIDYGYKNNSWADWYAGSFSGL
jgi:hypothetical protein